MAEPFVTFKWMGRQIACYLHPDTHVADVDALATDARACCRDCGTLAELKAEMRAVAERHDLAIEYTGPRVPSDPVERLVSFGFMPPTRRP
jgi:hypothetical protein